MWRAIRLISLLIISIIFYLPLGVIEDPIGYEYYFVFYTFLVIVMISIVLLIEYRGPEKRPLHWVILILVTIAIGSAPHKVSIWYVDIKEWVQLGESVNAQELHELYFINPKDMVPPMKYVTVDLLGTHLSLQLEYDSTEQPEKEYEQKDFFNSISRQIASDAMSFARYRKLETMSAEVIYTKNITYILESFSLREKKEYSEWIDYMKDHFIIVESN